ncbi:hypothetical protein BDQ17DRAFT_1258878 [Cyathus striatus]|nr:hypothetical protein BDQ17DRAFT_1258878 [Cyathus striatus]
MPPFRWLFQALCLLGTGRKSLDELWRVTHTNCSEWQEHAQRCMTRYHNTNIVVSLLLGATATLVTAGSARPELIDHTRTGTYICVFVAFGLSLGAVSVASAVLFALNGMEHEWVANDLLNSKSRIWCNLYILAFPHCAVGVSVSVLAIGTLLQRQMFPIFIRQIRTGLILAAGYSELRLIRVGSYFIALPPILSLFAFLHMVIDGRAVLRWAFRKMSEESEKQ